MGYRSFDIIFSVYFLLHLHLSLSIAYYFLSLSLIVFCYTDEYGLNATKDIRLLDTVLMS